MTYHDFDQRAREADQPEVRRRVAEILTRELDAVRVERAEIDADKLGVDFWAVLTSRRKQGVDLKFRRRDWGDMLCELVSRQAEGVPGWTINPRSITDYVLVLWPDGYLLLPYPVLRATVNRNAVAYREKYLVQNAKTSKGGAAAWETVNVGVPLGRLFYDMFGLNPHGLAVSMPRSCPSCQQDHPVGTTCQS